MKCGIECLPLLTIQSTLHPRYVCECKQSTTKTVTHLLFSHFRIVIVFSEFLLAHCPFPKPQLHIINSLYVATMGMKKNRPKHNCHISICVQQRLCSLHILWGFQILSTYIEKSNALDTPQCSLCQSQFFKSK